MFGLIQNYGVVVELRHKLIPNVDGRFVLQCLKLCPNDPRASIDFARIFRCDNRFCYDVDMSYTLYTTCNFGILERNMVYGSQHGVATIPHYSHFIGDCGSDATITTLHHPFLIQAACGVYVRSSSSGEALRLL